MNQEDFYQIESSQRQVDQEKFHYWQMVDSREHHLYNVIKALCCKISKDGDKWCCLYGEDLVVGYVPDTGYDPQRVQTSSHIVNITELSAGHEYLISFISKDNWGVFPIEPPMLRIE